jgi:L-serine dehydratase
MLSVFELFKIGIGPSSSHTMGPMRAAAAFCSELLTNDLLDQTAGVTIDLFGSLALTGKGHAIDRALLLGLEGDRPERVDLDGIEARVSAMRSTQQVRLCGTHPIAFDERRDVRYHRNEVLPQHPNGMRFTAWREAGNGIPRSPEHVLLQAEYFSIGGGFISRGGAATDSGATRPPVPFDFHHASDLIAMGDATGQSIANLVAANEHALDPSRDLKAGLLDVWQAMQASVARGLGTTGELPGGLRVRRRAPQLAAKVAKLPPGEPLRVLDMVSVWAMAANEENAAGGRVVTAPTNGASGLIPAVLHYYKEFVPNASDDGICTFLLTAAAIGFLCKENASISGAEVGCQGEVGVACAMAAAGLVAVLGGSNRQMEQAAEIGIEHHLGLTCDPIGGLVQIPCIERNAVGAMKAIHAARMAMNSDGNHTVSLDQAIETMRQTGRDMQASYKETSLAGLAVNVINC